MRATSTIRLAITSVVVPGLVMSWSTGLSGLRVLDCYSFDKVADMLAAIDGRFKIFVQFFSDNNILRGLVATEELSHRLVISLVALPLELVDLTELRLKIPWAINHGHDYVKAL